MPVAKKEWQELRIDSERMRLDFEAVSDIGSTGDGGVHRPALSPAHLAARAWFREQIVKAGLEFRVDGAGNHSATLSSGSPRARTLLLGSHLDSVPYGGRFDGPLGVLGALEVLRTIKETGVPLVMNLEAIDFTDEEGALFGMLGSRALAGHLTAESLQEPSVTRSVLEEGMARAGLSDAGILEAARDAESLGGYLEVHIEQGKRLERAGAQIGIVPSLIGLWRYRLVFVGRADHAGTIPMDERLDAAQGASRFALDVRELVITRFPGCVANVGDMVFAPGSFNIVPASVTVSLEFRAPSEDEANRLRDALMERARAEAERAGLGLRIELVDSHLPTQLCEAVQQAFVEACDSLQLRHVLLPSYAGHDVQSLASLCPAGLIFVPSVNGTSHSPMEYTKWMDCINGANMLLQTALCLAS